MFHKMLVLIALVLTQQTHGHYLLETNTEFHLTNEHMEIHISKKTGNISAIITKGKNLLSQESTVEIDNHPEEDPREIVETEYEDSFPHYARVQFTRDYAKITLNYQFTIDSLTLRWEVEALSKENEVQEVSIDFNIPIVRSMNRLFYPALNTPLRIEDIVRKKLIYRRNLYMPIMTTYNSEENYGLSFVAPFEIPKPGLYFSIDNETLVISYYHLRLTNKQRTTVGIYFDPHEGDWRQGLAFLLNRYPTYFHPTVEKTKHGEGWYVQGRVQDSKTKIEGAAEKAVTWSEFHYYFPFYGLYVPKKHDWALIPNSDEIGLSEWKAGAGNKRNSHENMKNLIDLWHKHGIQVYLYFQCFESWHQYAERYFTDDIARNEESKPHSAWKLCNLMNPDPSSKWGKHIMNQANDLIEMYSGADGIFYDRMDYWKYDFAHDDSLTIVHNKPAYMLAFAQEKINEKIFNLFHKNNKGIWGNVPTSIEVCKNLDGIMAEANPLMLRKFQYFGLVRPLTYLAHDARPADTENKLKNALVCGAYPSITNGGRECKKLDEKYRPLFDIMYNREWVLHANPLHVPDDYQANIFKRPDSTYVAYIINPDKSRLPPHPFDYDIPITVNLPDVYEIEHVYLLSGDWAGVNAVEFKKTAQSLHMELPCHLASSALHLTKSNTYDFVRLSSPVLVKGQNEDLVFRVLNLDNMSDPALTLELPWHKETKTLTSETVAFHTKVPETINGEITIKVAYNEKEHTMSCWVLDPISISPKGTMFIKFPNGDDVPFYITNNTTSKSRIEIKAVFTKGRGTIKVPQKFILQPFQSKNINLFVATENRGEIQVTVKTGRERIVKKFAVESALPFSDDDLFHDDFSDGLDNWIVGKGEWRVINGVVQGSGPAHFASVNNDWKDYVYEVRTRIRGSNDVSVDWLKSYIFFRVRDSRNLYRLGIHGDAGVVDLYKCVNGRWTQLGSSMLEPQKDTWYVLKVEARGSEISGYVDGRKVIEATDQTFLSGGIGIGVLEDGMMCDYKDVVVRKL